MLVKISTDSSPTNFTSFLTFRSVVMNFLVKIISGKLIIIIKVLQFFELSKKFYQFFKKNVTILFRSFSFCTQVFVEN